MKTIQFGEWFNLKVQTHKFTDKLKQELDHHDVAYKTENDDFGTTVFLIKVCGLSNLSLVTNIIQSITE